MSDGILLPGGGYQELLTYRKSLIVFDGTICFCRRFMDSRDRTVDQMVQAARSGVQNIAEGSVDAATSSKLELNLYNVARASLEELRLDYEDYLRQHNEPLWTKDSSLYREFIFRRIADKAGFRAFIGWAETSFPSVTLRNTPYKSVLVANATLLLISAATYFLKRQIDGKAKRFLDSGGFAERMSRMRREKR